MATSADMQLELILALTDKMSGGLDKSISKLRQLDAKAAETYKVIANLQRVMSQPVSIGGFDKSGSDVQSFARRVRAADKDYSKLRSTLSQPLNIPDLSKLNKNIPELRPRSRRDVRDPNDPYDDVRDRDRPRRRGNHGGVTEQIERGRDVLAAPRDVSDVWRRETDSLRPYVDATLDLTRAQEKFRALNLGEASNLTAFDAVRKNVSAMKGLSLAETTKELTDLHTATGSLGHAIESLPAASKYHFAFSAIYGDKFSNEQIEEQIQNAFKYLEMTGKVSKGREELERSLNTLTQIGTATGGRVNPQEMLLMARRGGASVRGLSDEGLRHLIAPAQEFGGSGLGVSMMSAYQVLVSGVMQEAAAQKFVSLGLVDPHKIVMNTKTGMAKKILPGGNILGDQFMQDPLKAVDTLREAMRTHGTNVNSDQEMRKVLAVLFQNRTSNKLIDTLLTQRSLVTKDAQNSLQSEGYDALTKRAQDSPLGKIKEFEAELTDFKARVGVPMIDVAMKLGTALLPIGEFFAQHEGIARFTGEMFIAQKGLSGILGTATTLNQSGLLGFFSNTGRGASIAAAEIEAAATKTSGLKSKFSSLAASSPLKLSVQFLVAGAAIDQIMQWKREYDDRQKDMESKSALTSKAYDDYIFSGHGFVGGKKGQEYGVERDSLAQKALDTFKGGRTLEVSLEPERRGLFENFWTAQRMYSPRWFGMGASKGTDFDPARAATVWRSSEAMRPLGDPTVLAKLLMKIDQGAGMNLSPSGKDAFKKGLALTVDKDTYSMAVKLAAEETTELGKTTQGTSKALGDLLQAANPLPSSLSNFGSALQTASAQASGFHIEMPNMTSIFGNMQQKVEPSSPRPQFNLGQPSAKPRSSLDTFFHKTSALDADAVRRPVYTKAAFNQRGGAVVRIDALHVHGGGDAAETARQAGAEVERKVLAALAAQDAKLNRETSPRAIHKKWRDEQQIKEERA